MFRAFLVLLALTLVFLTASAQSSDGPSSAETRSVHGPAHAPAPLRLSTESVTSTWGAKAPGLLDTLDADMPSDWLRDIAPLAATSNQGPSYPGGEIPWEWLANGMAPGIAYKGPKYEEPSTPVSAPAPSKVTTVYAPPPKVTRRRGRHPPGVGRHPPKNGRKVGGHSPDKNGRKKGGHPPGPNGRKRGGHPKGKGRHPPGVGGHKFPK